jgi:hypothetical protein
MAQRKYKRRKNGQFASKGEGGSVTTRSKAPRKAKKKLTREQKARRVQVGVGVAAGAVGAVGLARARRNGKVVKAIAQATKKAVGGTRAITAGTKLKKAKKRRGAYKITSM